MLYHFVVKMRHFTKFVGEITTGHMISEEIVMSRVTAKKVLDRYAELKDFVVIDYIPPQRTDEYAITKARPVGLLDKGVDYFTIEVEEIHPIVI